MTMPSERTRSLRQALEFMTAVKSSGLLTPELRNQLDGVLRHYPSTAEIAQMARRQEHLATKVGDPLMGADLLPEDYYDRS